MNEELEEKRLFADKVGTVLKHLKNLEKKIPLEVYQKYLEKIAIVEGSVALLDCYIDQTFKEKKSN